MAKKTQSEILDGIKYGLQDQAARQGEVVFVSDPRHPNGGYYVQVKDCDNLSEKLGSVDDIERYLRS